MLFTTANRSYHQESESKLNRSRFYHALTALTVLSSSSSSSFYLNQATRPININERHTDRQTYRHTDRQTDRQTDRHYK